MTVCIAAMSGRFIFGIADRMLTAGDIQYEPPASKIIPLTSSMVIMTAGDASFQSEIILEVIKWVQGNIASNPKEWLHVKDVANSYARFHNLAKATRAANVLLTPLGLDNNSFIARQHEMSEGFINSLAKDLVNFEVPGVEAIIAGNDPSHPLRRT